MSQSKKRSHQEILANTIIGILISNTVLFAFGIPLHSASAITFVMIVTSYIRGYAVRRFFAKIDSKGVKK